MSKWASKLVPMIVPALVIIIWIIASRTGALPPRILPGPDQVWAAAVTRAQSGELWANLWVSAQRAL
jgi:sulfonate transport system permease protein